MKAAGVIAKILVVILLLGGIIGIAMYFSGYSFYVTCEDQMVFDTAGGFKMTEDEELRVDVGYAFNFGDKKITGYSVKVVPNAISGKNFDFEMDRSLYSYQAEKDLTAGFNIVQEETYFTISPKGGITDILKAVYPDAIIGDCRQYAYDNMYSLIVYSHDGEEYVKLNFSVVEILEGVELDKEAIEF